MDPKRNVWVAAASLNAGPILQRQGGKSPLRLTPRDEAFNPRTSKTEDFPLTPTHRPSTLGLYVPDAKDLLPPDSPRILSPSPLPTFEHPSFEALNALSPTIDTRSKGVTSGRKLIPELSQKRGTLDWATLFVDREPGSNSPTSSMGRTANDSPRDIPHVYSHGRVRPLSSLGEEQRSEWRESIELLKEASKLLEEPLEKFSFNATWERHSEDTISRDTAALRKIPHPPQLYDAFVQRRPSLFWGFGSRTASLPSLKLAAKLKRKASRRRTDSSRSPSSANASTDPGSNDTNYQASISSLGTVWSNSTARQVGMLNWPQRVRAAATQSSSEQKVAFSEMHSVAKPTTDAKSDRLNGSRTTSAGQGKAKADWQELYFGGYSATPRPPRKTRARPDLQITTWNAPTQHTSGKADGNLEDEDEEFSAPRSAMEHARRSTPLDMMYGLLADPGTADSSMGNQATHDSIPTRTERRKQVSSNSGRLVTKQVTLPTRDLSRGNESDAQETTRMPRLDVPLAWAGDAELPLSPDSANSSTGRDSAGWLERSLGATPSTPYTPHTTQENDSQDGHYGHKPVEIDDKPLPDSPQSTTTLKLTDSYDDPGPCPQIEFDFGDLSLADLCDFPEPPKSHLGHGSTRFDKEAASVSHSSETHAESDVSHLYEQPESTFSHETGTIDTEEAHRRFLVASGMQAYTMVPAQEAAPSIAIGTTELSVSPETSTADARRAALLLLSASVDGGPQRATSPPHLREMRLPRLFERGVSPGSPFLLSSSLANESPRSSVSEETRKFSPRPGYTSTQRSQSALLTRRRGYIGQRLSVEPALLDQQHRRNHSLKALLLKPDHSGLVLPGAAEQLSALMLVRVSEEASLADGSAGQTPATVALDRRPSAASSRRNVSYARTPGMRLSVVESEGTAPEANDGSVPEAPVESSDSTAHDAHTSTNEHTSASPTLAQDPDLSYLGMASSLCAESPLAPSFPSEAKYSPGLLALAEALSGISTPQPPTPKRLAPAGGRDEEEGDYVGEAM